MMFVVTLVQVFILFSSVVFADTNYDSTTKNAIKKFNAIQIIKPNRAHNGLEISQQGLEWLERIDKKVAVVSIVGRYHSGKSFLLNALINLWRGFIGQAKQDFADRLNPSDMNVFTVAKNVDPSTMGLWLVETDIVLPDGSIVMFLDSEGFYGKDVTEAYDAKIFTAATLLSSHLIYNSLQLVDQNSVDYLEILARRTELFQLNNMVRNEESGNEKNKKMQFTDFPQLSWIVGDFTQDLGKMTENQWLDQYILGHRDNSKVNRDKNIKDIFKRGIQCHTMFLPSTEEDALKHLGDFDMRKLEKRFMKDLQQLKDHIANSIGVKRIGDEDIDGKNLSALVQYIIQFINEDNFPQVPSMMEAWIPKVLEQAPKDALVYYQGRMAGITNVEPPLNKSRLQENHDFVFSKSLELFKEKLFNDQKLYTKDFSTLQHSLKSAYQKLIKANAQKIDLYIEQSVIRFKNDARDRCRNYEIPMNPETIKKDREKTLQEWFVHYLKTFESYKESAIYDDQRELLRMFVEEQFNEIVVRNDAYIQNILNQSLQQCKRVYTEKLDLKNDLPRVYEDLRKNQQLASSDCDQVIIDYIKEKINANSLEWIEKTDVYKSFFNQLTEWKKNTNKELIEKNNHQVELLCKDKVIKLNGECAARCSSILPFPDEEDVIQTKVNAINSDLIDGYIGSLSKFSGFDAYQHYLGVLKNSLVTQVVKTIDHNADAVNLKSTQALECAKYAIEKSQCSFCLQNWLPYSYRKNAIALTEQCFNHFPESRNFGPALKVKAINRWIEQKHQKTINGIYTNLLLVSTLIIGLLGFFLWILLSNNGRRKVQHQPQQSHINRRFQ